MRLVSLVASFVEDPAESGAEGIHGPPSLPDESDEDEELPESDGGPPNETPGGSPMFLGGLCASARAGSRQRINAATRHNHAAARQKRSLL
jgi:hypothetical protein